MNGFKVEREDKDNIVIFNLSGHLDAHTAPDFEEEIEKALKEKKFNLIVNLEKLDYIASAGLGVFMGYIEDIRENNGDIIITNSTEKVYKVFDLLGFPNIFKIHDSIEVSINEFKND